MKKKITIILIVVLFLLAFSWNLICRNQSNALKEYELDIYIPDGLSYVYKSKHFGMEKLWVHKISQENEVIILNEIDESSKWNYLNNEDEYIEHLETYIYFNNAVTNKLSFENVYYSIYNPYENEFINISQLLDLEDDKTSFIIFIYDETNNNFFTSYNAMWT